MNVLYMKATAYPTYEIKYILVTLVAGSKSLQPSLYAGADLLNERGHDTVITVCTLLLRGFQQKCNIQYNIFQVQFASPLLVCPCNTYTTS